MIPDYLDLQIRLEPVSPGNWVALIQGPVDFTTSDDFTRRLERLFEPDVREVLFDITDVHYLSSMGLSAVIGLQKRARERGMRLSFYDPQIPVQRVFEISKMDFLILDPHALDKTSPFWAYVSSREPEREKKRALAVSRKTPPRLYS